jgi:hypothetical protein
MAAGEAVINANFSEIAEADIALNDARRKLETARLRLRQQELALGLDERETLATLLQSEYFTVRMNARALKIRIRERLRQRKLELDTVERAQRNPANGANSSLLGNVHFLMMMDRP